MKERIKCDSYEKGLFIIYLVDALSLVGGLIRGNPSLKPARNPFVIFGT